MIPDTPTAPPGARNATLQRSGGSPPRSAGPQGRHRGTAAGIRARGGRLVIDDSAPELGPDGVTMTAGDVTAGGVMHAVTSVAQTLPDADAAHEMESQAVRALGIAAALEPSQQVPPPPAGGAAL